ncbi:MAG: hypothetical protein WBB38_09560 [Hyphomicrobiaceae bacterium]|mgnify:CR=1 FL=1|jgi:hypothetical protein
MSTPMTYAVNTIPSTRRAPAQSKSWIQRAFDRLLSARHAQAERYLVDYLSALSDERLRELGYGDEEIRQIRVERRLPESVN